MNTKITAVVLSTVLAGLLLGCNSDSDSKTTVSPEKQEIVKEGFSGQKDPVVETKGSFTGSTPMVAPTPSEQGTPTIDSDKAISQINDEVKEEIKGLEKIESELEELQK